MRARWALSRSGSPLTAARQASTARPYRPAAVKVLAEKLESVEAQLVNALALSDDPLVIPVWQQLAPLDDPREPFLVAWRASVEETMSEVCQVANPSS